MSQKQKQHLLHEPVAENQAKENPGLKITINNQGHYNTPQSPYFFNTYLKVSSVSKYPLYKNTVPGGTYYE